MELPGGSKRGRAQRKFMNVLREDMQRFGVTEQDVRDMVRCKHAICCGDTPREPGLLFPSFHCLFMY